MSCILEKNNCNLVIQTMAKDEEHILNEWVLHHILLGVEHIYIYDDNSNIPISTTISILPEWIINKITVYRLEENDSDYFNDVFLTSKYYNSDLYKKISKNKQQYFLNHFLLYHKHVSKWCFFCDVDEFIWLNDDINIIDLLNTYDNYDVLYIPWVIYGSSYHINQPEGSVMDNFRYHENCYSQTGKSISKLSNLPEIKSGHLVNSTQNIYKFDINAKLFKLPIHINHYQISSVKTYITRKLRHNLGQPNGAMRKPQQFFSFIRSFNDIKSNIMDKYYLEVKKLLKNNVTHNNNNKDKYINYFFCNNKYIYECNNYDVLIEMLNDTNLRYCTQDEDKSIIQHICTKNKTVNFNPTLYKELNPDLNNMTDLEATFHYHNYGYKENRKYKYNNKPEDFNVAIYKELNPDLNNITDLEATLHYDNYGYTENRKYKYNNKPDSFNATIYKELNPDLKDMTDLEATLHYDNYGYKENRKWQDVHFNQEYFINKYNYKKYANNPQKLYSFYCKDIRQQKNNYFSKYVKNIITSPSKRYIMLVNHDDTLYGANHYIYLLYSHLTEIYKNYNVKILLCEFLYKIELFEKYSIPKDNVLEYYSDPTLLYMLYKKINPKIVYLNSCNYAITKVYKYIPKNNRILHSHETFEHYLLSKNIMPNYVVGNLIADQYFKYYQKQPDIQLPFLVDLEKCLKLSKDNIDPITNKYGEMDINKITIGMCGQITQRKNYELFIEISKNNLNYNFVWIGDFKNTFDNYVNIYHIKLINNPYKYFKQVIDYFMLFSKVDPCPYVILENILLESNIITFSKNIFYEHKHELLKNIYFSYDGEINLANCQDAINKYVKCKKNNNNNDNNDNNGYKYIKQYFTKPTTITKKIKQMIYTFEYLKPHHSI